MSYIDINYKEVFICIVRGTPVRLPTPKHATLLSTTPNHPDRQNFPKKISVKGPPSD